MIILRSDVSAHKVTSRISKEAPSFSASPLPLLSLYLPSEGLVFSVSPLYRESLMDDSLKTLPTEQRKQARRLAAMVHTHTRTQQQTHTGTCSGWTEFASVILWVTKWSSGEGRGIWEVEVIIFQGALRSPAVATARSSAHLILGTSREGGRRQSKQHTVERRRGRVAKERQM